MKVLIVEDTPEKYQGIVRLLKELGITDCHVEKFVSKAILEAIHGEYDILITDLGLPRFLDKPIVQDNREGLKFMYDLSYYNVNIPTVVYSTTEIYEEQLDYLKELEYPFLGQVQNLQELEETVKEILSN